MLSCKRRTLLLSLLALPVGCGFTPLYRQGGAASGLQGNLRFSLIDSREGFILLETLEHRFGRPAPDARFNVALTLDITQKALTLNATSGLTRYTLSGKLGLIVTNRAGDTVLDDSVRETAGYTGSAETLVTDASKKDAYRRLTVALADSAALRLAASSANWAQ